MTSHPKLLMHTFMFFLFAILVSWMGLSGDVAQAQAPVTQTQIPINIGMANGAWPDAVEIDVPPAPRNMVPQVALVANHTTTDGELGSGWTLVAGSVITRHSTTGGTPNYTTSDLYRLDGVDLYPKRPFNQVQVVDRGDLPPALRLPGGQVDVITYYEPKQVDGSQLYYMKGANTWARKKDGWVWTYDVVRTLNQGTEGTHVVQRPIPPYDVCATGLCKTSAWYLSSVKDPWGNTINYHYTTQAMPVSPDDLIKTYLTFANSGQMLLTSISYNGDQNTIKFIYGSRPDVRYIVENGRPTLRVKRLAEITTSVGTQVFSRYTLQYEDEAGKDCDGKSVNMDSSPKQTLLRKIIRVGPGSSTIQHTLRCMTYHHEDTEWESALDAKLLTAIEAPTSGSTKPKRIASLMAIPIAVNLDSDGISDLVVIGVDGSSVSTVRAYVATPGERDPLTPSSNSKTAKKWEGQIASRIGESYFKDHRGFALLDIDRDYDTDLIWEDDDGKVWVDVRQTDVHDQPSFSKKHAGLDKCALRFASFADIDGDGYVDAVVRAHTHKELYECPAEPVSYWLRNSGASLSSWFSAERLTFRAPLEHLFTTVEWITAKSYCKDQAVAPPYDFNPNWEDSAKSYIADHMRVADFNGDGIADIAYSLYACWTQTATDDRSTPENEADWNTVPESVYSRIFFGDGKGNYLDSKLSAGKALTYDLEDALGDGHVTNGRITTGLLMPLDVDHNGLNELLSTRIGDDGTAAQLTYFHGLTTDPNLRGWGVTANIRDYEGFTPDGLDYLSQADNCNNQTATQVIADFNGDGMPDILTLQTAASDITYSNTTTILCDGGTWCARLHLNKRTVSEGRMAASDGPWGGRTTLTWGFSAKGPHENPSLPVNLEVIAQVKGADGTVALTYSGGTTNGREITPFALVERQNQRGGVDQISFITAPWAAGKPSHAARFRSDGTLQHLAVYEYGGVASDGFIIPTTAPYFNPLARQCDYEVEASAIQVVEVSDLIAQCYAYRPSRLIDIPVNWTAVSMEHVPSALGHYRQSYTVVPSTSKSRSTNGRQLATNTYGPEWTTDLYNHGVLHQAFIIGVGFRWPVPPLLADSLPPVASTEAAYQFPVTNGSPKVVESIQDWEYDLGTRKPLRFIEHRDTSTAFDNRIHEYTFEQPDPTGYWYRKTQENIKNYTGYLLASTRYSQFVPANLGFTPTVEEECGDDRGAKLDACPRHVYDSNAQGELLSHQFPDSSTESWSRGSCGQAVTHTDGVSRVRSNTYDSVCRLGSSTFEGATETFAYDGLGRIANTTVSPGGGAPTTETQTFYDDALTYVKDTTFLEPRVTIKRSDGKLIKRYLDEFGRLTKETECATGTSVNGIPQCTSGPLRTTQLNLYGNDGLLTVWTEPFWADGSDASRVDRAAQKTPPASPKSRGRSKDNAKQSASGTKSAATPSTRSGQVSSENQPVTHGIARDQYGRVIVELNPAHQSGAAWVNTTYRHYADAMEVEDPLHRVARTMPTTKYRETSINGIRRYTETYDTMGRLFDTTAPDGMITHHAYDTLGNLEQMSRMQKIDCVQGKSKNKQSCSWSHDYLAYDRNGRLLHERTSDGVDLEYTYDGIGRLKTRTVSGKLVETRAYRNATKTTLPQVEITDENGAVTTLRRDGLGRVLSTHALGTTESVTWGENGLPATRVDRNGRPTRFVYDTYDFLQTMTAPGNAKTTFQFGASGRLLSTTDADGVVMKHEYTYAGDLAKTVRANTWTEVNRVYDGAGRVVEARQGGVRSAFSWDDLNRLTKVTQGENDREVVIDATYDLGDRLLTRTKTAMGIAIQGIAQKSKAPKIVGNLVPEIVLEPKGSATTRFTYDPWGRLATVVDPAGTIWTTERDIIGRPRFERDPLGVETETRYDERGRVIYYGMAASPRYTAYHTNQTLDNIPNLFRIETWDGEDASHASIPKATTYLDALGRERAVVMRNGLRRMSTWDGMDLLAQSWRDPAGTALRTQEYQYDKAGRVARVAGPHAPQDAPSTIDTKSYAYTTAGRMSQIKTSEQTTAFTYHGGLLATEQWDDQFRKLLRNDPQATWITAEELSGTGQARRRREFTRDGLGEVKTETTTAPRNATVVTTRGDYTPFGRARFESRTINDVLEAETTWTFDNAGRPTARRISPSTGTPSTVRWSWLENGWLSQVTTPSSCTVPSVLTFPDVH